MKTRKIQLHTLYDDLGKHKPRKGLRTKSRDMCPCCYYANCDNSHAWLNTPYIRKRAERLAKNLCVACGRNPCKCKRRNHFSNVEDRILAQRLKERSRI